MYLTEKVVDDILEFVASMPRSSAIAFSFANQGDSQASVIERTAEAVGEPWLTKFQLEELERKLHNLGFADIQFLTPQMIAERYIHDRQDGLMVPRRASIVSVKV